MLLSAIAIGGGGSCGDWVTTEAQARPLADSVLARYAARVGLPLSAFDPPEATTDGPHRWIFVYRSRTVPPRRLRVRVGGRGRVEPSAESE